MFDKSYYQEKKIKLQQKSQANLQKFINSAFDMVYEANDINERVKEIDDLLAGENKAEKTENKK